MLWHLRCECVCVEVEQHEVCSQVQQQEPQEEQESETVSPSTEIWVWRERRDFSPVWCLLTRVCHLDFVRVCDSECARVASRVGHAHGVRAAGAAG